MNETNSRVKQALAKQALVKRMLAEATRAQRMRPKPTRAKTNQNSTEPVPRRSRLRSKGPRARQTELVFRSWGGARPGAGRKPKGEVAMASHHKRPAHESHHPVLVTTHLRAGLRSLRHPAEAARIRAALASALMAGMAESASRAGQPGNTGNTAGACQSRSPKRVPFQVVHHTIQSNHLHLIVEAPDRRALSRGIRGLLVRIARALNKLWERRGPVFADRFHELVLSTPRQVRNALVYVLQNLRKHDTYLAGPDPYSSAPQFDGWRAVERIGGGRAARVADDQRVHAWLSGGCSSSVPESIRRAERAAIPSPSTWLLGVGWQRHGLIDPSESPREH